MTMHPNLSDSPATLPRRAPRTAREGAAMLMVLMVLMMSTATATFAIHSTMMELRSAGYGRQAMQTSYVAEGAAYAGLAYMDAIGPQASFIQYSRTTVPAGTEFVPGSPTTQAASNILRIQMEDFATAAGVSSPPVELEVSRTPSLGPRTLQQPSFIVDGTDLYRTYRQVAGRDQTGRDPMTYARLNLTARGTLSVPSDPDPAEGERAYHETVVSARAMAEMGPFAGGM